MATSDWRSELQPSARKTAVKQIMNAVKLCHHIDDEDELQELEKFSRSFEQKTLAGATSQSDYLQKITSKEVFMNSKSLNLVLNSMASNLNWEMQEEVYQKIRMLKEMYLPELNEMHQKITNKIGQHDSLRPLAESDMYKLMFKTMLERLIAFLQASKGNISPSLMQKLPSYEERIINFVKTNRPKGSQIPYNHASSVTSSSNAEQ